MPITVAAPKKKTAPAAEEDFLPLEGTDYVEFYVATPNKQPTSTKRLSDSRVSPTWDRRREPRIA